METKVKIEDGFLKTVTKHQNGYIGKDLAIYTGQPWGLIDSFISEIRAEAKFEEIYGRVKPLIEGIERKQITEEYWNNF